MLDADHRSRVIAARDGYEQTFREVIAAGAADGSFRGDVDPRLASIFLLSVLNAIERWYKPDGRLDRRELSEAIFATTMTGLAPA
jgi:hypothetical protein